MAEWLAMHRMDRAMLMKLQANLVAYTNHQAWSLGQSAGGAEDGNVVPVVVKLEPDCMDEDDVAEGEEGRASKIVKSEPMVGGEQIVTSTWGPMYFKSAGIGICFHFQTSICVSQTVPPIKPGTLTSNQKSLFKT